MSTSELRTLGAIGRAAGGRLTIIANVDAVDASDFGDAPHDTLPDYRLDTMHLKTTSDPKGTIIRPNNPESAEKVKEQSWEAIGPVGFVSKNTGPGQADVVVAFEVNAGGVARRVHATTSLRMLETVAAAVRAATYGNSEDDRD